MINHEIYKQLELEIKRIVLKNIYENLDPEYLEFYINDVDSNLNILDLIENNKKENIVFYEILMNLEENLKVKYKGKELLINFSLESLRKIKSVNDICTYIIKENRKLLKEE